MVAKSPALWPAELSVTLRVPVGAGGFADEVVAMANRVLPIPDALSDGQGATFMQSYLTAWFAFTRRTQVEPGKTMLVLGAGGSRGFAHVGVIKALEAAGIVPDMVVGSSAGAVVAALYAGGNDAGQLEKLALEVEDSDLVDITFFGPGRVRGEALQNYVNRVLDNRSIEQLPRPFAVVATERADKRMTVFNRGNAGLAVRASASIPDVFWPALIGGVEYVDGGLTSRVPVAVARRMGADVVVAVDVSWRGSDEVGQADVPVRPDTPRTRSLDFSAKVTLSAK